MADFTVGGQNYRSAKMDAMKQFHVARRLAPVFSSIAEAFKDGVGDLAAMFEPLAKAISGLSDADSEFIINACLDSVSIQQGQIWSRVRAGNRLMFDFIGFPEMMQIARYVLEDNFAPFFSGPPAPHSQAAQA